ncbi:patched domain-containing protein 3-like isoform X1 [Hypanus sabinus]|uniref:patched domain-containing protein 3-like isoform X1 n=1 Tax=Hypanus sabinus TaxID=79690 RepID=UPI0028C3E840|nr:patched domain-containing protein 3-like isoform X1 [Hypanus sabinus]
MPCRRTDCIEKPLSQCFKKLGYLVGKSPWWFLTVPLLISAGLGAGFYFLPVLEANDLEEQFTPIGGPAKSERDFIKQHFPTNDSESFSAQRLYTEGTFASFIAVSKGNNILTINAFKEIISLDEKVKQLNISDNHHAIWNYSSLCVRRSDSCISNAILKLIEHNPTLVESTEFTYPRMKEVFIGSAVGGVKLKPKSNTIETAKAIQIDYYLQEDNEDIKIKSLLWLKNFLSIFPNELMHLKDIKVSYFTSVSRQDEFEGNTERIVPFFSITYFLSIFFSITSCMRFDCVRNKVWVAALGVVSAGFAVLSGFGLLLFCGMKFAINTANAPFLILGIGVDDMFVMLSGWQKTKVEDKVEKRLADTYAEAAVSITITTLTDVLAFYIGIMTPFRSVQSFCVYTGTTVLFCFIYNITFFGAVLALNGRREASNRHWLTFRKVDKDPKPGGSTLTTMCCVGGAYDPKTGTESEHPIYYFMKEYYGPFLTNGWTKAAVVFLYLGYLAAGIYGCLQIKEGIDLRNLAFDDSYVIPFYDAQRDFFSEYGPRVMVTVTESVEYWNSTVRSDIETCMERFENLSYVDRELSESWLHFYVSASNSIDINKQDIFMTNLATFLQYAPAFKQDIDISENELSISASRFFIQTMNVNSSVAEKNILTELRDLAKKCRIPLLVYHSAFIYFDQYLVIVSNTIQNVVVAALAMLLIALLLIPNPVCSLWVTLATASVLVGVTGFMAFWGVNLDSISMINLVICIGFSVDFSAHISYAFVSSGKSSYNERAIDALYALGYPIIQGAVSTILGVVVLAAAGSYIFRTFFKIMFLVISFGAVHGLVFLPVFLTFCGLNKKTNSVIEEKETNQQERFSPNKGHSHFGRTGNVVNWQKNHIYYNEAYESPNPGNFNLKGKRVEMPDPDCP